MNSLVAEYRKRVPSDPRSDDALTMLLGQSNADGRFNSYKDFLDDYQRLTQPEPVEKPPIGAEFRRGVNRGVASLKSSAVGLAALGADVVGADDTRNSMIQKYNDLEAQSNEDNAPGVSKVEDIHGVGDAARYALGKAGELVPNVAEAGVFGAAGALAGSTVEPGAGTVAGGTAGLLEGFLGRQAAKSALKALLEKGEKVIADKAARELVISQLEGIGKREAVGELLPATQHLLETEGKALARKYGANAAEVLNFTGLGAGGQFPRAEQTNPEDAKVSALIAGIGGAAGTILPAGIISKLFPGVAENVATTYLQRLASNAAQHVPAGVVGMGAMELGNIAAERYADPKRRDQPLSDEELSRIMNASVVGGMSGLVTAPVTAIRPAQKFDPTIEQHFANVTPERRQQLADLKGRVESTEGKASPQDVSAARTLTPEEKAFYAVATGTPPESSTEVEPVAESAPTSPPEPAATAVAGPDQTGSAPISAAGSAPNKEPVAPTESAVPTIEEQLQRKRAAAAVSLKAQDPTVKAAQSKVAAASAQTNPTPTTSEKLAGNYEKGKLAGKDIGLPGIEIAIENPVGSERTGIGPDGQPWKVTMPTTYGQILGTKGRDGDPLDIHIGPNPTAETVYVVDQIDPKTGKFDEHKSFVGFESRAQAEAAYESGFSDGSGESRKGAVRAMSKADFAKWVKSDDTTKALSYKPRDRSDENPIAVKGYRKYHGAIWEDLGDGGPNRTLLRDPTERGGLRSVVRAQSMETVVLAPDEVEAWKKSQPSVSISSPSIEAAKMDKPVQVSPPITKLEDLVDIENRGVERQSARGRGNRAAREAWDRERETVTGLREWKDLTKEERETFIESRPELRASAKDAPSTEKAWFRPRGDETPRELGKRLVSDSSPPGNERNSKTYRLSAIEDKESGKVHLVSTFVNNGQVMVTRFTDAVKTTARAKAVPLSRVLEALDSKGGKRFEVIGSARMKGLHEYANHELTSRAEFEQKFAKPVEEAQNRVLSTAEAVEKANTQAKGKQAEPETEAVQEELPASADESSVNPEFEHEPEPLNLVPHEVTRLVEGLKGRTFDELSDAIASGAVDPELLATLKKIGQADRTFFGRVEEVGVEKALKEYGYETDAGKSKPVEQSAAGKPEADLPDTRRSVPEGTGGTPPTVEGQQDISGQAKQLELPQGETSADAGGEKPDRNAEIKFNLPGAPRGWDTVGLETNNGPHDPEAARLLNSLHEAATRAGIDVQLLNGPKMGLYRKSERLFVQALTDTIGRGDVKTAFHEIGHDVFSGESPEVRDRLVRAIDRLSDEALGVDASADTRIRSSDPANLGKPGVNEERLVEATAQKLMDEGFKPDEAKGFAQSFIRTLKDLYYRATMAVQRWLDHPENPELARRYFENRVKSLLAGDTKGQSYVEFVGARKLTRAERWKEHFDNGRILGERVSPDGRIEYDHVPDLDLNSVRFNLPDPPPDASYSRKTEVDQAVARLNHLTDTLGAAAKAAVDLPGVATEAQRLKLSADEYVRRLLRIADPAKTKAKLANEREANGETVAYDPQKKLEDFGGKANRDQNIRKAYGNVERLLSLTGKAADKRTEENAKLTARSEKLQKGLTRAEQELAAIKEVKKDPSNEVANLDKTIGRYEYRRDALKRRLQATERRITRNKIEIQALEKMVPSFSAEKSRLGSKLKVGVESTWGHGMPYNVPENANASSAEIVAKDATGKVKSARTLKLDSSGVMTDPKEVETAIEKQTEFLAHREAKARAGDENALDDVYYGIKHQRDEMLANKDYSLRVGPADRFLFGLTISPAGDHLADGMGTPEARAARLDINRAESIMSALHETAEKHGRRNVQAENALIRISGNKFSHDTLWQDVINPALHTIENANDLAERYASDPVKRDTAIYRRIRENILKNDALREKLEPVIDQFMPLLEKKIREHKASNQFLESSTREGSGVRRELGIGVRDKSLMAINPATGNREVASRAPTDVGPDTFSKRFSQKAVQMSKALRASGWDGFGDTAELFKDEKTREKARADLLKYTNHEEFGDSVRGEFVRDLMEMEEKSPFLAPEGEGEVSRAPADPELMREAFEKSGFEQSGDLVALAEAIHEAHGGTEGSAPYVQETLEKFGSFYNDIIGKLSESNPDPDPANPSILGMTPPAMIDARSISHLPGSWLDYHRYDQKDMIRQVRNIAAQQAFGRGGERLNGRMEVMAKEIASAKARIGAGLSALRKVNPNATEKEIKAFLTQRFGKETYATLTRQAAMDRRLTAVIRELSTFFRKDNSPDGTLSVLQRGAHALGMLMVQQPASAIRNMEQLFAMFMKFGLSRQTLGATGHTLKEFGSEAVNSLVQALGFTLQGGSEDHRLYVELGHTDPLVAKRFHDAFDPQQGEGKTTRFLRGLNDIINQGVNRRGEEAEHTVLRPAAPFTWTAVMQDKALTAGAWHLARSFIGKGMDFYKANPEKLEDRSFKLTPETFGLKGATGDTFKRFNGAMQRWDVNFDQMVRGAMQRGDKTLFTNEEAQRLYGLSVSELSSESNISTMAPGAFNNSVLRVMSPLLGWPFRRMMDVLAVGRTPEGKHDLATVARGMAGLSVLALGGLGVSALVNQYQENIVGKKPNLRSVLDAPDATQAALGVFENLSRAGSFGLLGEIANGFANVGLGGDNRSIVSLDQRVVALSALGSLQQAISSWINQGQVDYAHVVRPLASSMGGNGALQYMDIANNVLGLDNFESRVVARINAQNYLRVVGRQLGLEVRASAGGPGGYSPTPMSPSLTRMELAAYKNDAADFQEAYFEAVQKAKEAGFDDPVGHVKASFGARNPLRTVFSTSPTQGDYNRILAALPDGGRRDVEQAVDLFNQYAERIGARPFEGKQEKKQPQERFTMPTFGTGNRPLSSNRAVSALFAK